MYKKDYRLLEIQIKRTGHLGLEEAGHGPATEAKPLESDRDRRQLGARGQEPGRGGGSSSAKIRSRIESIMLWEIV